MPSLGPLPGFRLTLRAARTAGEQPSPGERAPRAAAGEGPADAAEAAAAQASQGAFANADRPRRAGIRRRTNYDYFPNQVLWPAVWIYF